MPRDVPVGNGSLLLAYDRKGLVRDVYYPNVGMENHAQGHAFRVGVRSGGTFLWLDDDSWERSADYEDDTLVAQMRFTNRQIGLMIGTRDVVDFHENVYLREMELTNLTGEPVELRVFFHHDFHIYGTDIGDTACYKPEAGGILHYKGRRYFLMKCSVEGGNGLSQYATGVKESKGLSGTWVDAEDGILSGNPISQGSADSTMAIHLKLGTQGSGRVYHWMSAAEDWKSVQRINSLVEERSPAYFIRRTADYWRLWLEKENIDFDGLPEDVVRLYKRSLLTLRTHVNENGAIIASVDSDIQHFYRDTYCYCWPRDGAIVAHALDLAGYPMPSRAFYNFCGRVIGRNGYFLHKYNPDGSLASSWHPWLVGDRPNLPIQEDETGLVLWALWDHFRLFRDIEFIKPHYRKLIKSSADFMCDFTDPGTGLPMPSYDLWEERLGIHTYTVCSVIAGLRAASNFVRAFGETDLEARYTGAADRMRDAMVKHMFDPSKGRFLRSLYVGEGGTLTQDSTLDSSLYAIFAFGALPASDPMVGSTMRALKDALWCRAGMGGMARYENDTYQSRHTPSAEAWGNPWIICTLWYAQYLIARATSVDELKEALPYMGWVVGAALPSGVLSEQVDPYSGEPLSVSPLTWSHAEFVITVQTYLDRLSYLSICPECKHPHFTKYRR